MPFVTLSYTSPAADAGRRLLIFGTRCLSKGRMRPRSTDWRLISVRASTLANNSFVMYPAWSAVFGELKAQTVIFFKVVPANNRNRRGRALVARAIVGP